MATRFDYRNVAGQCKKENRFEGGKPYEFGLAIDKIFGKGRTQRLFKLSETSKQWEIGELESSRALRNTRLRCLHDLYDQFAPDTKMIKYGPSFLFADAPVFRVLFLES